jgi:predicted DCC family thiol-disulfide oxidoreductase YuxK
MPDLPEGAPSPLVLFDGVCNLCSGFVAFCLTHESGRRLRFAAMQSETGQAVLRRLGLPLDEYETVLFLEGDAVFRKSDAFFRVVRYLRRPWSWLRPARAVPRVLRDWLYDRVSRNRYRLFGRRAQCMVPGREVADRFLR